MSAISSSSNAGGVRRAVLLWDIFLTSVASLEAKALASASVPRSDGADGVPPPCGPWQAAHPLSR